MGILVEVSLVKTLTKALLKISAQRLSGSRLPSSSCSLIGSWEEGLAICQNLRGLEDNIDGKVSR